jgi:hypothetical protein
VILFLCGFAPLRDFSSFNFTQSRKGAKTAKTIILNLEAVQIKLFLEVYAAEDQMSASDWIGLGIIALVIVGGLLLLNQITKPYDVKDEEEFQRKRKEGGLLSAGMMGLQQLLDPSAKKAAEVQEDLRRGVYDDEEEPDDPPEAGADARKRGSSPTVRESSIDNDV